MSEENINPNALLAGTAKPRLTAGLIISLIAHILLLGITSIGFIGQCVHYKTMRPKDAIKLEQKAVQEAEKKKAEEDRMKNAQLKAAEEAEKRKAEEAAAAASKKNAPPAKKSKMEKSLEETLPPESAKGSMDEGLNL